MLGSLAVDSLDVLASLLASLYQSDSDSTRGLVVFDAVRAGSIGLCRSLRAQDLAALHLRLMSRFHGGNPLMLLKIAPFSTLCSP